MSVNHLNKKKAFTLVEMLVALALIVGIGAMLSIKAWHFIQQFEIKQNISTLIKILKISQARANLENRVIVINFRKLDEGLEVSYSQNVPKIVLKKLSMDVAKRELDIFPKEVLVLNSFIISGLRENKTVKPSAFLIINFTKS